jgi:geranylgeranyl pyrophosphate synthase
LGVRGRSLKVFWQVHMMRDLRKKYAPHLAKMESFMLDELARWRSDEVIRVWSVARAQIERHGKQLRPLLALAVADLLGGELDRVVAPAASVEFYHMAALILDDVQDNAEIRRGEPTVSVATTRSTAVNIALFMRSLSYHSINHCSSMSPAEKLILHRELDNAASHLILGQSVDVGWHEDWYESYLDFPYMRMIAGKSGSLFGCAAAMGACAASADSDTVSAARDYGTLFGVLYQMVDDYLDVFGDGTILRRPPYEDFREGKMTLPVLALLSALAQAGETESMGLVLSRLAARSRAAADWGWLLALMSEFAVAEQLRRELAGRASELASPSFGPAHGGSAESLGQLVSLIAAPVLP